MRGVPSPACTSLCATSRATILTGTYNHINGVMTLSTEFDARQATFVTALQAAGFRTALFGKWHLGHGRNHDPRGFDVWELVLDQDDYHHPTFLRPDGTSHVRPGYVTDVITDLAIGVCGAAAATRPAQIGSLIQDQGATGVQVGRGGGTTRRPQAWPATRR